MDDVHTHSHHLFRGGWFRRSHTLLAHLMLPFRLNVPFTGPSWQKNCAVSSAIQTRALMSGITNKLHHRISKLSSCAHLVAANYEFACLALRLPFTTHICRGTLIRDRCLQSRCFAAVSIFFLFLLRVVDSLMPLAVANPTLDFVSLPLWLTRCRILRRSLCLSSCVHYYKTPRWP